MFILYHSSCCEFIVFDASFSCLTFVFVSITEFAQGLQYTLFSLDSELIKVLCCFILIVGHKKPGSQKDSNKM